MTTPGPTVATRRPAARRWRSWPGGTRRWPRCCPTSGRATRSGWPRGGPGGRPLPRGCRRTCWPRPGSPPRRRPRPPLLARATSWPTSTGGWNRARSPAVRSRRRWSCALRATSGCWRRCSTSGCCGRRCGWPRPSWRGGWRPRRRWPSACRPGACCGRCWTRPRAWPGWSGGCRPRRRPTSSATCIRRCARRSRGCCARRGRAGRPRAWRRRRWRRSRRRPGAGWARPRRRSRRRPVGTGPAACGSGRWARPWWRRCWPSTAGSRCCWWTRCGPTCGSGCADGCARRCPAARWPSAGPWCRNRPGRPRRWRRCRWAGGWGAGS